MTPRKENMTSLDGTLSRGLGAGTSALREAGGARRWLRAQLLKGFFSTAVAAGIGFALYEWLAAPPIVSTDDAYVGAVFAQVTPQIDGTIGSVRVHDTQYVHKGDVLVILDPKDAELDFDAARAAYEGAYRRVEQEVAETRAAETNVLAKQSLVTLAEQQLRRRTSIRQPGVVSAEEISNLQSSLDAAKYALAVAEQQLAAKRAVIRQEAAESNPDILGAEVNLRRSRLRLERTFIRAPVDGIVAQSRAQIGQKIAPGSELMTIVPTREMFVDANFKESQITEIRAGQLVTLKSDSYGSSRIFHGHVQGVGGGTGATFAVIPPQNATGNWIKVVQRLPVRIALDQDELLKTPLRAGISMTAEVHLDRYVDPASPSGNKPVSRHRSEVALRTDTSGRY